MTESRDKRLNLALTEDEKQRLQKAARARHMPASVWARSVLLEEAEKVLSEKGGGK